MRISDWSSDVCSSDLFNAPGGFMIDMFDLPYLAQMPKPKALWHFGKLAARFGTDKLRGYKRGTRLTMGNALAAALLKSVLDARSEERRGGNECVRTCSTRW